ncbi:kinase/pyrophosphorylase [Candidatus Ozemobacteraceae bacterium]|nr:kinase/pyrophosphorylase [Candidatus Ozemobacteraceae bacterium]
MSRPVVPFRIFVVSGGVGACGEQVVNTVLAQFPDASVEVVTLGNIRENAQLDRAVDLAAEADGIIVFSLVEARLGAYLRKVANRRGITALDITGPLLETLANRLEMTPLGQPGLYRQLHREYFDRVAAIEFTMSHDDGRNQETWHEADILLLGVSRTGKTPLSIYLSVLGWKVANFPIVPGLEIPELLFRQNASRVIGLTLSPDRLLTFRRHRSGMLGMRERTDYIDPNRVAEELEFAGRIFTKGGFEVMDVTDKTVEASANEIIKRLGSATDPRRAPPV